MAIEKDLFKPVKYKAGPGRPKGSVDKKYLSIQFWYDELRKDWTKISAQQRAKLSVQLISLLVGKTRNLPQTQGDSVENATEALELLKQLEQGSKGKQIGLNEFVEPSSLTSLNNVNICKDPELTKLNNVKPS